MVLEGELSSQRVHRLRPVKTRQNLIQKASTLRRFHFPSAIVSAVLGSFVGASHRGPFSILNAIIARIRLQAIRVHPGACPDGHREKKADTVRLQ